MKKVVIGLSGGMDSATLLGILLEQGCEVHCCSFQYGSKHMKYENEAARKIHSFYFGKDFPVSFHTFDLRQLFKEFKSDLLLSGGEIPEGHYEKESMKATVVPGRNLIFASLMAGFAESKEADAVALGVHSGDHYIYPDCRPEFVEALRNTILESSDKKIDVITPLGQFDKTMILQIGLKLSVPYYLTRTCYKDQPIACGLCGSCNERLEAFENCNIKDVIDYEYE